MFASLVRRAARQVLHRADASGSFPDLMSSNKIDKSLVEPIIKKLKYENMTSVQAAVLDVWNAQQDLLVRSKTGTGKTIAFLLPTLHRMLHEANPDAGGITGLIVSPTRELAAQIANEAISLTQNVKRRINVRAMFGGTNVGKETTSLRRDQRHGNTQQTLLITTPGRVLDHLKQGNIKFDSVHTAVFDEMDRLFDMGFRREVQEIVEQLPATKDRQTLLFSATLPDDVQQVARMALKDDYLQLSTIPEGEIATQLSVRQFAMCPPHNRILHSLLSLLKSNDGNVKAMVFVPTAKQVMYFHELLSPLLDRRRSWVMHSRKTQVARTKVIEQFRKCDTGVLFTTDITARGMDFPNVTHVIQVGVPTQAEQYVHRLGRTARGAGMSGEGYLILAPEEKRLLQFLKGLPIETVDPPANVDEFAEEITKSSHNVPPELLQETYLAMLGYYSGNRRFTTIRSDQGLVDFVNSYTQNVLGCHESQMPGVSKRLLQTMGFDWRNLQNIRITRGEDRPASYDQRSGRSDGSRTGSSSRFSGRRSRNDFEPRERDDYEESLSSEPRRPRDQFHDGARPSYGSKDYSDRSKYSPRYVDRDHGEGYRSPRRDKYPRRQPREHSGGRRSLLEHDSPRKSLY